MTAETISIELSVQTNKVGSKATHVMEFDLEDWQAMDETTREKCLQEELFNVGILSWDWKELP